MIALTLDGRVAVVMPPYTVVVCYCLATRVESDESRRCRLAHQRYKYKPAAQQEQFDRWTALWQLVAHSAMNQTMSAVCHTVYLSHVGARQAQQINKEYYGTKYVLVVTK